jgi:MYXO-CTERM domain-containing protein
MCSSTTDEPGTCEDDAMPPTGGSGGSGGSDGGAGDDAGVTGGSGGMSGGEGGESGAAGLGAIGTLGGGGCDCRAVPGQSPGGDAVLLLTALALLWSRRRR